MNAQCSTCIFVFKEQVNPIQKQYWCRRYPPTVHLAPNIIPPTIVGGQPEVQMVPRSTFPPVASGFVCGEYRPEKGPAISLS